MRQIFLRVLRPVPRWLRWSALGLFSLLFFLSVWGIAIEPRLVDLRRETATIPNLPAAWEGQKIALIADLQIGMWWGNEATVTRIVNEIIAERPAFVLVAGDFVYKPTDEDEPDEVEREEVRNFQKEVDASVALLRPLRTAGLPVYAVRGNHDYGMNHRSSIRNDRLAEAIREALEEADIRLLENTSLALPPPASLQRNEDAGGSLYLVGIGSRYAGQAQATAALAQVPAAAPRIIFLHNPDTFSEFPADTAPLVLAGHTHGGQIRLPFTANWSWMSLASDETVHADGWIDNYGQPGNRLYVNRGIGFSSFPVRINCRPELTLFTLQREGKP